MGRDSMSVVDAKLQVYGIENRRIADGSILPRITTGNTMAPCVIIGERAAEMLQSDHRVGISSANCPKKVAGDLARQEPQGVIKEEHLCKQSLVA
jgi:choline dehydrogenase-like flavoprotein